MSEGVVRYIPGHSEKDLKILIRLDTLNTLACKQQDIKQFVATDIMIL